MAKTTDELFAEATEADYETAEPVTLAASDTEEEFQFRIDEHLRTIAIPEKGVVAGVEGDLNVNIARFTMTRYYHGRDLSKLNIRINYRNANGQVNYYTVSDATASGDSIIFSWEFAADVTQYKGNVQFVVYLFSATNAVLKQRFFTTLGTLEVLEGLEVDSSIPVSEQTDILLHLKKDLSAYAEEVKKSLPADYTAMTEQVNSLKEEKVANSGWGTNKYLGTDSLGRVVEKGAPSSSGGGVPTFLQGYNYYAMGDSIVELQGTTDNPVKFGDFGYITDLQSRDISNLTVSGYIQAIEERYGLVCTNFGASGHTLVQDYASLVAKDYSNVACATIGYGVNDARTGVPLGTVNSTDISTFAGALNMLLRKIYTDNPECRVLVLTPIQRLKVSDFGIADANANGNYLVDFVDMCKKVANKRSTKCVDMYRDCGINQTNLYFYTVEGVHPNNQGFGRMRNAVISALDDLFTIEYEPLGSMTSIGDTEPEEPDTGDSGSKDNPPEEEIRATEVDISSRLTKDGYYYDGYTSVMGRGSYSGIELPLIELIEGKTYTLETYTNGNTDSRYAAVSIDENASNGTYLSYSSTDTDGNWVFTLVADGVYKASVTWVAGEQKRSVSGVQTPCLYLSFGCLKGYEEKAKLSYI